MHANFIWDIQQVWFSGRINVQRSIQNPKLIAAFSCYQVTNTCTVIQLHVSWCSSHLTHLHDWLVQQQNTGSRPAPAHAGCLHPGNWKRSLYHPLSASKSYIDMPHTLNCGLALVAATFAQAAHNVSMSLFWIEIWTEAAHWEVYIQHINRGTKMHRPMLRPLICHSWTQMHDVFHRSRVLSYSSTYHDAQVISRICMTGSCSNKTLGHAQHQPMLDVSIRGTENAASIFFFCNKAQ
jgi:hypothetical protein